MSTEEASMFQYRTLSEGVEHIIRRMIFMGELHPGERINEVQIAEQLQVSRGPVREALRRLQAQGFVVYHAHRGTFVPDLAGDEAEEVYRLRATLEVGAVRMALPRITNEILGKLDAIADRFQEARRTNDVMALIQADMDFHHTVVKLSGNGRLFDMYKSLDMQLGAMFLAVQSKAPTRIGRLTEMHRELVVALASRDEGVACQVFEQHYLSAWQSLQQVHGTENQPAQGTRVESKK